MPDFLKLKTQNLKYLDALTYASIRSFHNSTTDKCYPSYEKIMERSGLSRGFIADSIKRLENSGLININHSNRQGQCNQYKFKRLERFERIPYELFTATDLSVYEKAMLLCLRQFFNHGLLSTSFTITTFAKHLGLTYKQVYNPYRALVAKGYITEVLIPNKRTDTCKRKVYLSGKLNWLYEYMKVVPANVVSYKLKIA